MCNVEARGSGAILAPMGSSRNDAEARGGGHAWRLTNVKIARRVASLIVPEEDPCRTPCRLRHRSRVEQLHVAALTIGRGHLDHSLRGDAVDDAGATGSQRRERLSAEGIDVVKAVNHERVFRPTVPVTIEGKREARYLCQLHSQEETATGGVEVRGRGWKGTVCEDLASDGVSGGSVGPEGVDDLRGHDIFQRDHVGPSLALNAPAFSGLGFP
jgi:hypothetical protein